MFQRNLIKAIKIGIILNLIVGVPLYFLQDIKEFKPILNLLGLPAMFIIPEAMLFLSGGLKKNPWAFMAIPVVLLKYGVLFLYVKFLSPAKEGPTEIEKAKELVAELENKALSRFNEEIRLYLYFSSILIAILFFLSLFRITLGGMVFWCGPFVGFFFAYNGIKTFRNNKNEKGRNLVLLLSIIFLIPALVILAFLIMSIAGLLH